VSKKTIDAEAAKVFMQRYFSRSTAVSGIGVIIEYTSGRADTHDPLVARTGVIGRSGTQGSVSKVHSDNIGSNGRKRSRKG